MGIIIESDSHDEKTSCRSGCAIAPNKLHVFQSAFISGVLRCPLWASVRVVRRFVVTLEERDALAVERVAHRFGMHEMRAAADLDVTLDRRR
jgi:hypothetical protein